MKTQNLLYVCLLTLLTAFFGCKSNQPQAVTPLPEPEPTGISTFVSTKDYARPVSIAFDKAGNLFFSNGFAVIYKVTPDGKSSIYAGGSGYGYKDGPLATATFLYPSGLVFDSADNLYVADSGNKVIRKITPDGQVTTFAGLPYKSAQTDSVGIDGVGKNARFANPVGITVDKADNIYVSEYGFVSTYIAVVRKITPAGKVTTLAGTLGIIPESVYKDLATLTEARCVATNAQGEVFIGGAGVIHKVSTSGKVEVYAGQREKYGTVYGPKETARFGIIGSLAFDAYGNLYVGELGGGILCKISPAGQVSNIIGNGSNSYVDGPIKTARISDVAGLAFDKTGNLFLVDMLNFCIRKIEFQ